MQPGSIEPAPSPLAATDSTSRPESGTAAAGPGHPWRSRIWLVGLAVIIVGGVVVAYGFDRKDQGPASVDALMALLVDTPGNRTQVEVSDLPPAVRTGFRWAVVRRWDGPDGDGNITLYQYETVEEADAAYRSARRYDQDRATNIDGLAHAFSAVEPPGASGVAIMVADSTKGSIYIDVNAYSGSPAYSIQLLAAQLHALP